MKLIERTAKATLAQLSEQFPVILLTGARQVGKTTLLKMMSDRSFRFVSLDDTAVRRMAKTDPSLFMQSYPPPLIIDEIQYATELLPYIKMAVDANPDKTGQYWLTGSQPFHLMKGVGESLAGRVAVFPIGGISQGEEVGRADDTVFGVDDSVPPMRMFDDAATVFERIHRGSFPAVVSGRVRNTEIFYRSYVQTYLERDVRDLAQVADILRFQDFLSVAAARTGQLMNLSNMAADVGISPPTARAWLSILEASGIVYLLKPYFRNITSRIVKTPKLYFLDTGLVCHLTGWSSPMTAMQGAMAGALFETFVVSEIVKRAWNIGINQRLWFYRDKAGAEVDLLIEQNGALTPIEIKKTAAPSDGDIRHFAKLTKQGFNMTKGAVVCLAREYRPLNREVTVIPVASI